MNQTARGITIYFCGHESCAPGHFFGPAIRTHYLLHVILKGKGIYRTGSKEYSLKEGEGFLIKPQEVTYYEADPLEPWEYAWVSFAGGDGERLLREHKQEETGYIYGFEEGNEWKRCMSKLVELFLEGGDRQDAMTGYFYLLFSMLPKRKEEGEFEASYLLSAESYIHHNFSYSIRIEDVARHVGIDRTYLYKLFMKHKKISPKQYLTAYRIMEAKRLLEDTELSMTETGLSCGFHDASVFCRCFQQAEGQSPLQYRKGIRSGSLEYNKIP